MTINSLIQALQILEKYCIEPYPKYYRSRISADNDEINVTTDTEVSAEDQALLLELGFEPNYRNKVRNWLCVL